MKKREQNILRGQFQNSLFWHKKQETAVFCWFDVIVVVVVVNFVKVNN